MYFINLLITLLRFWHLFFKVMQIQITFIFITFPHFRIHLYIVLSQFYRIQRHYTGLVKIYVTAIISLIAVDRKILSLTHCIQIKHNC